MEARRQAFVQPTPEQVEANRKLLTEMAARPRGEQEFVQVDYLSAEPDPKEKPEDALRRREQRRLADLAESSTPNYSNPLRAVFEKVFAPYRENGTNKVFGFSFDKLIDNVDILQGWLSENPQAKAKLGTPYELTSPQLAADVTTYLRNQSNGYGGDGSSLVRPPDMVDAPVENPNYTPVKLSRPVTNVINMLMGMPSAQKLTVNEAFNLRFAEANGLIPARTSKGGIEVNLLRNQLRESGFDPRVLNSVLENLRIDRIGANVVRRPDLPMSVVEGAFVRAGFMPAPAPETPEFKRWFGDSKIVDENGKPKVMFHGTNAPDFTVFRPNPALGGAIFVSPSAEYANVFTGAKGSRVYPVFVKAEKTYPKLIRWGDNEAAKLERAKELGYDSARVTDGDGVINLAVFNPTQVKSATGNTGAFSPTNPDIRFMPLAEEMGRNIDYTTIPPDEKARAALSVDRQPKYGVARDLKAGTPVGLRIDIPAFKRTSEAGDPVYVITVHKKARGKAVGEVIGYDNIAAVDDPVFESNEVGAQKIREGFKKFPIATVEGAYNPSREIPDNIEEWTPVGFDPKEHSYFYDKRTGDPVVSGDRAISVGNTVFVENPVFGNRADYKYMPAPAGEAPLANETPENLVSTPANQPLASATYEEPSTVPSERGVGPRVNSRGAAEAFRQALVEAAASQPAGKAVTIKDVGDYVVSQLFLSDDRTAGAAVTPDGDLVSVFKKKGSKTNINDILDQAAPLAKTLDAYASGDGYLPNLYAKHGFRPVARVKFNREFAPEGWPYEILGEPDVVLMVRDPEGVTGLPALNGDYNAIVPDLPDVSYDEALALQRDAVDQVASNRAFMAAPLAEETIATEPGILSRMKNTAMDILYSKVPTLKAPEDGQRNGGVARMLASAALEVNGRKITSKDITPEETRRLAEVVADETEAALKEDGSAVDWYTKAIRNTLTIARSIFDELNSEEAAKAAGFPDVKSAELGLLMALAITSQNLKVSDNAKYAVEQFESLARTGRFDSTKQYGTKAPAISSNLDLANELIDRKGWLGLNEFISKSFTVGELSKTASDLLGEDIVVAGRVDDVVQGAALFGPKIGQGFLQNLLGNFDPVTVDLWLRRTWGRLTGDVIPKEVSSLQLAAWLDSFRDAGIPLPESLKTIRVVTRARPRSGKTYRDLTPDAYKRFLNSDQAREDFDALNEDRFNLWQRSYKNLRLPMEPALAQSVRNREITPETAAKKVEKVIARRNAEWQAYLEKTPRNESLKKPEFLKELDAREGRTDVLSTKELSAIKPEWAKSTAIIDKLGKPIDAPTDQDRAEITKLLRVAREILAQRGIVLTNADLQATIWYPEKDIWAKLRGDPDAEKLKSSYDTEFLKIADSRGRGDAARTAVRESRTD
jgi:hypothetical protein